MSLPSPQGAPLTSLAVAGAQRGPAMGAEQGLPPRAVLQAEGSAGDGCSAAMPPSTRGDSSSTASSFQTLIYCELGVLSK